MGTDGAIGRWLNPKRRNQAPTVDRGIRNARPIAQAGKPCCSRNWRMNVTRTGEVMCGVCWGLDDLSVSNSWSGRHWDGDQLVAYLARQAQTPRGRAPAIAR